jgi:hypothetical protein
MNPVIPPILSQPFGPIASRTRIRVAPEATIGTAFFASVAIAHSLQLRRS